MEASQWSLAVCILMCSQWVTVVGTSCDRGWFGDKCQYKCRCENLCDFDGRCKSWVTCYGGSCISWVPCQGRWFGPACQYADIAYRKLKDVSLSAVVDGDDFTCLNKVDSNFIKIDLGDQFWLTWLRVRVSKPELLLTLEINFGNNETCAQNVTVDRYTLDLHCILKQTIQYIYISGQGMHHTCSLYVSGGRNVALRQSASQSSTLMVHDGGTDFYFLANNSVDGNIDTQKSDSCSITKGDVPFPRWNVSFTNPQNVYWIVLYILDNMVENPKIINTFKLQAFDKDGAVIFSSSHTSNIRITIQRKLFGTKVVSITAYNSQHELNICEVEVYGDSSCPEGKYGRECEFECNCQDNSDCFVSTGGCPAGCAEGYQGESCSEACEMGKYGQNCIFSCSDFCVPTNQSEVSSCDHVNGSCLYGCLPGYQEPSCDIIRDEAHERKYSQNVTTTVVICVLLVVVIALVIVALFVLCRRRQCRRRGKGQKIYVNDVVALPQRHNKERSTKVHNQEARTDIAKQLMTSENPIEMSTNEYNSIDDSVVGVGNPYRNIQDVQKTTDKLCNHSKVHRHTDEVTNDVIYEETACNSQCAVTVHDQELRTEKAKNDVYDLPEKCESSDESSYPNIQDVQLLSNSPYQQLIGLSQDNEATSLRIYDETLGSTHSLNKERSSAGYNQEKINRC